jgi:hypothetical protein
MYLCRMTPLCSPSPADICIARAKLFFSRPSHVAHTEKILFGLPEQRRHLYNVADELLTISFPDVLNRLNALYPTPPTSDPAADTRKQYEKARHFAKFIFPRQYRLPHPFMTDPQKPDAVYDISEANREIQIRVSELCTLPALSTEACLKALGSCKTPKRLQKALTLVEKMIWRHRKCGYKALLQKTCPPKASRLLSFYFILIYKPHTLMAATNERALFIRRDDHSGWCIIFQNVIYKPMCHIIGNAVRGS